MHRPSRDLIDKLHVFCTDTLVVAVVGKTCMQLGVSCAFATISVVLESNLGAAWCVEVAGIALSREVAEKSGEGRAARRR